MPVLGRLAKAAASCAAALLTAASLWAAPSDNPPEAPPFLAAPTDLEFAGLLFRAGRIHDALAFLEQARPARERDRLERHLLLGRIHLMLERPAEAAEHYEAALAMRPELTEARLGLARALFLAGDDRRSRHHFELALGAGLPSPVEEAVGRHLSAIAGRKRWSAYFSAALLPETNAARRTDSSMVDIGGMPFQLNDDARSSPGTGLQVSLGGVFSPALGDRLRGHFAVSASAKAHQDPALGDIAVKGRAGLTRLTDSGRLTGGLQAGRRWVGGKGFQRSAGLWWQAGRRVSERARSLTSAELDFRRHDNSPDQDGWLASYSPSLRLALDGATMLEVGAGIELVSAGANHHASRAFSLSAGVVRSFANSLTASLSASLQWRNRRGRDPLFDRVRKDRTLQLGGRLSNGAWSLGGFAPYVGYSFETNASNIEIHEYVNHGLTVGLTREF